MTFEPGEIDSLPAVLEFDPAACVPTSYGRVNGDAQVAERFLNLCFRI